MNCGQTLFGFAVKRIRPIEELEGTFYELEHIKSGAQLVWLSRAEQNKTFMVGFQTLPENDTGVFHILEHSVLCGSKRFPVKEPFVELVKGSLNTFLNAMTFPDKTVYPVSSRNETDFFHLMNVYMDAVFAPAIYSNPNIFKQEGWHYELHEGETTPTFKGVVFNEMKGAYSSVGDVIISGLNGMLFPDNCYGYESGGFPPKIPQLSYEKFIETHKRFYHPSNAKIFLDGDMPIERVLEWLDKEYLCTYDRRELDFALQMQKPVARQQKTNTYAISASEDPSERAYYSTAMIAGDWSEKEKMVALSVLCSYLTGSQTSPLKAAILENGLGQDVSLELNDYIAQPFVTLLVENTREENFEKIEKKVHDTLTALAENGLDRKELLAWLNRSEFQHREKNEPQGVELGIESLRSWLYGGDPALYLSYGDTFASLHEKLDTDYFERLLKDVLLDETHTVILHTLPSATKNEEDEKEEKARLAAEYASWDEEKKREIIAQTAALEQWQQTPDTLEQLASLPHLKPSEVDPKPQELQVKVENIAGVTVLRQKSAARGVDYLNLYFALSDCMLEDYPRLSLMCSLLGNLSTAHYDAQTLQREIKTHLGSLSFTVEAFASADSQKICKPFLTISCSVLDKKAEEAVRLISEIILSSNWNDPQRIKQLLLQMEIGLRQKIMTGGRQYVALRVASHLSAEGSVLDASSGYRCYCWLHSLAADFERQSDAVIAKMEQLQQTIFCKHRLTFGTAGELTNALVEKFAAGLPEGEKVELQAAYQPQYLEKKEAIVVPSGVSYAGMGASYESLGVLPTGDWRVLETLLSYQYLWNEVRVQGGAYGTAFTTRNRGTVSMTSYRDPNPMRSLAVFGKSDQFIREFCESSADLNTLIIGAISDSEPLLSPKGQAAAANSNYWRGISYEDQCKTRTELLQTDKAGLLKFADIIKQLIADASVCVVGPESCFADCDKADWEMLRLN